MNKMNRKTLCISCILALACATGSVLAATAKTTSSPQFAADSKAALARYQADKALCDDEPTSGKKMQCRRDAKAEYDQAIAAAKSRASVVPPPPPPSAQPAATHTPSTPARTRQAAEVCHDCGTVIAVSATEKAGEASALGTIAGGIGGALLGNQVGAGSGKDLATLAGAVGGAYAGRVIEEKVKTHTVWTVTVQYANGERGSFDFSQQPGFSVGDVVKNEGDSIVRQLPAPRQNH